MNGDTVLVSPDTYEEHIDFKGKAITVASTSGPGVMILDKHGSVVHCWRGEGPDDSAGTALTMLWSSRVIQGFDLLVLIYRVLPTSEKQQNPFKLSIKFRGNCTATLDLPTIFHHRLWVDKKSKTDGALESEVYASASKGRFRQTKVSAPRRGGWVLTGDPV